MISFQNSIKYVLTFPLPPLIRLGLENRSMLTVADKNNKTQHIWKEANKKIDMVDETDKIQNQNYPQLNKSNAKKSKVFYS